jgi:ATP-dependent Clp protease ATP-binding subunit ClpC
MGFGAIGADAHDYDSMKDKITEQAKRHFKPEFLNRLDDLIVFHMLEKTDLIRIVDLEIAKVLKRVRDKHIHVELDETAKEFLIVEGYDPQYGARPMRRAVERHLEDPFAEHLLRGDVKEGDTVKVTRREGEKALKFSIEEQAPPAEGETAAVEG